MRIAYLVNLDVHACVALNLLRDTLARHTAAIFYSTGVGRRVPAAAASEVAFLRQIEHTIPIGELFPHVERVTLHAETSLRTFGQLAAQHALGCEVLDDPNSPAGLAALRAFAPDVIVSIRYGRILRGQAIAIPPHGVLNLHAGVLPAYRGVLASFRAMLAGEPHVGCTLHRIVDPTIDTGPIIDIARVPRRADTTYFDAVQSVYPSGAAMIASALEAIVRGDRLLGVAPANGGQYFTYPTADEFADFRRRGYRLFDAARYADLLTRFMPNVETTPLRT